PPWRSPRNTSKIASAIAPPIFLLRYQLLQFLRHFWHRRLAEHHSASLADDYIVLRPPGCVETWMINPTVSSSALLARQCAARDGLGNCQHCFQILGQVPAGVEQSRTFDAHTPGALFQSLQLLQRTNQIFSISKNA